MSAHANANACASTSLLTTQVISEAVFVDDGVEIIADLGNMTALHVGAGSSCCGIRCNLCMLQ